MLEHGGRLLRAVRQYGIPREQWLDLSSGIAPWPYAIPAIPLEAWARLPETEDGLEQAARTYYGASALLPVAGSQAAIQALPYLRPAGRVGVLTPCYAEHPHAWRRAGHALVELDDAQVEDCLDSLDVLVLVNPNNPTGRRLPRERLLGWHARLARRGGWLLVDEAFMDNTPADSLVDCAARPGLIVLRSFGKFFGLAGVRLGFVMAEPPLLQRLAEALGPWSISGPTRVLGQACFSERSAHPAQIARCAQASQRLAALLEAAGLPAAGGCDLFQYVRTPHAAHLHDFLARRGILVRLFEQPPAVRLGLPASAAHEQRLRQALADYQKESA
ncbi:threonine-phosphate decarboxylase CobD [Pseudomonas guariconensis]|uniref:threonine-phosphate decarboxylase CobD n=1 Tax=Pseudomonas TaxID=286 RepID=UPI0020970641|nr:MULTISPECIES: threonine-phosphate decarboxylase CobD [Pseudomonas]MCO7641396.1 threonine-phosphate decarboxylase CobD [Pseudomonas sp. S 311-6]MCO7516365.1 threonine-phosphate decarboxylase CobD [Pseudomonas putida]MCO7566610.1 threonine-phosphate decarboxylase CobD [Pseudomonas mosselii]MCO7606566.1 threonine-phosphate decarboxylase CobD [Pseudomonas guariconensis]MCO7617899.1 threonine-phosphate decarboxylase CobD [Pseudomonas guariconensis]